ncbi:hypothetical protein [Streptomyces sp. SAI-041]|jgi:hypothetical protein|nr:hypothetical protein [Streptomyces sp. SAI-041]MDH6552056.1 hypothetical protein [Streptomyces sp. SAI-041]
MAAAASRARASAEYYQRGRDGKLREVSTGEPVEFDEHGNHDD